MIPNTGSLVLQRRLRIAEVIRREGSMRVEALGALLGVSVVTVRADLAYLDAQGLVLRGPGHARPLPDEVPAAPDALPPAWSLLPLLRAARQEVEDDSTLLLGPGTLLPRLLPLLADAHGLSLVLCGLDAVPLARSCLDAPLHLLGGEIGPDGRIAGPKAQHGLALHDIDLLLVEARAVRGGSLLLAPGDSEALLLAACARARRVVALVSRQDAEVTGAAPRLPLSLADLVLLPGPPGSGARQALQQAGFAAATGTGAVAGFARTDPHDTADRHSRKERPHASTG